MRQQPVRIAGQMVTMENSIEVRNPYSQEVIGTIPACGQAEVDLACEAAAGELAGDAFPQHARARVLEVAAELLRSRIEDFALIIAKEAGKPLKTARGEATRTVDTLVFSAVEARKLGGELVPMAGSATGAGKLAFAMRVPRGVVAAISPFNFPLNLVAHKLGPAIAAGCPVVLKPASATPFSAIKLVELLVEAGLPAGWISVVTGSGKEVGARLVEHPIPKLVSFTGSPEVGWDLVAKSPKKKFSLELGSNAPLIIEPDADLELVSQKAKLAGFSHAGQSCISTQRILVHSSVQDRFVSQLKTAVESLVVGDPLDESTDMGPLISRAETERVRSWIEAAVAAGGELVTGGKVTNGILMPTVVNNAPSHVDLCAREAFGPVVVVNSYDSFEQAIEMANESSLGLQVGVFTQNLSKALLAARRLEFGGIVVNDVPTYRADQMPYGGVKESGNTREGPAYAVAEMTELRLVILQE